MSSTPTRILPTLVLAQFAGTSLWFAVNAVMPDLQQQMGWPASAVGRLTSALQLGFIVGTLVFALLAIADRFSSRRVFLSCALAGALCTLGALVRVESFTELLLWRAATGFFLAGIYPVGMKIASQWFPEGLGYALGWLVGALVLGSASAHGIRALSVELPWSTVMISVAMLAAAGGLILFMAIPEPPSYSSSPKKLEWQALATIWTDWRVRASVLGYFGHMWELYTLWVLVPLILATQLNGQALSFAAFGVLGIGALGCIGGGWLAKRWGSARVATLQLSMSGICCLLAPWLMSAPLFWFLVWLAVWGLTAAGDSPQFSTLTASNAPKHAVGSVLTLTNCIGFALSIVSIELFTSLAQQYSLDSLLPWLGLGPLLGIIAMRPLVHKQLT
ncbi:MAG: MFS transporter [Betaproteobacteria bacterium]|nr:MFS transporter [Betaproteobacteria bacterium]